MWNNVLTQIWGSIYQSWRENNECICGNSLEHGSDGESWRQRGGQVFEGVDHQVDPVNQTQHQHSCFTVLLPHQREHSRPTHLQLTKNFHGSEGSNSVLAWLVYDSDLRFQIKIWDNFIPLQVVMRKKRLQSCHRNRNHFATRFWFVWSAYSLVPLQSVLQLFGEQTLLTNLRREKVI